MKNVFIILLAAVVVLCGWYALNAGKKSSAARSVLDQERYQRISAEESLENAKAKAASLEAESERMNKKVSSLETLLEEARAANDELKARLKDSEEKIKTLDQAAQSQPAAVETAPVQ